MISEERKSEYWNHFTDARHRVFRPKKITDLRLRFIKKIVLNDEQHWREIIPQQSAFDKTPEELDAISPAEYRSARSSFWAMIREKIQLQIAELNYPNGEAV